MDWTAIHHVLGFVQQSVSLLGILIIISGVLFALYQYISAIIKDQFKEDGLLINSIRLSLGRVLILGLEFIVAADLIGTTNTPDYYAVGILAIIVAIRTLLSFSINRELMSIAKEGKEPLLVTESRDSIKPTSA